MGQWLETLTQWLAANPQWLGLALVIVACMECLAVVGLIVPGTVMVFAIAVLAGNGVLTLGETLVFCAVLARASTREASRAARPRRVM